MFIILTKSIYQLHDFDTLFNLVYYLMQVTFIMYVCVCVL